MPVERFVEIFAPLKPKFIHHPRTKEIIRDILEDFNCALDITFQDVPRLRAVTSDAYLTSGVGYAHHLHRDTWYSAPMQQINWWLPVFEIASESSMAFHPRYWSEPVKNGSAGFNYYEWNQTGRASASQHIKSDTRKQPKAEQPMELDPQLRIVPEPGGVFLFQPLRCTPPSPIPLERLALVSISAPSMYATLKMAKVHPILIRLALERLSGILSELVTLAQCPMSLWRLSPNRLVEACLYSSLSNNNLCQTE